ncbi:MAG: hypothetical protein WA981_08720 [Glaciecola sp.]
MELIKKIGMCSAALLCSAYGSVAQAQSNDVSYSVATGWPFVLVPTISIENNNYEYYANYKVGVDDGFSIGAQRVSGNHVYGTFIGALGARSSNYACEADALCDSFVIRFTDRKTTQGVGVSYEYRINSNKQGWAIRLEAGYGEESRNNDRRADANIQAVYHF